jgi:CheY-like chemotaxis protein
MASKILLADDSITIQKVVNLTFVDEGIEVVSVSNGEMAERRLAEVNPDLVLADIFMPGKNGYELCEAIKRNPRFQNVPVVLLVGAFEPFDQAEARRVGADTHLTKPFESRVLVETVRKLISSRHTTDALGSAPPAPVEPVSAAEPVKAPDMPVPAPVSWQAPAPPQPAVPDQLSFADAPLQETDSSLGDFSELAPLDLDYSSLEQSVGSTIEEIPVAARPRGGDFHFAEDVVRQTQQLGSAASFDQSVFGAVGGTDADIRLDAAAAAETETTATAVEDWSDSVPEQEYQPSGSKTPSTFGYQPQDMVLDFERLDAPQPPQPDNVVSFDVDMAFGTEQEAVEVDRLDTGALEPVEKQSEDLEDDSDTDSGFEVQPTIGPATKMLLAADNPLGDVLMDDKEPEVALLDDASQSSDSPLDEAVTDEPILDVGSARWDASVYPPVAAEQHANFTESPALQSQSPLDLEYPAFSPSASAEQFAETPAGQSEAATESSLEPEGAFHLADTEAAQESESAETGWAETDFRGSDSDPVGFDIAGETPQYAPAPSEIEEEKFTAAAMWTEEETRFTPIDIEAVPVEELPATRGEPSRVSEQEKGFDFMPSVSEQAVQEMPAQAEEGSAPQASPGETVTQIVELSPEMMNELVRRVVEQITESVVREIAWEVVPDCVDRILKEMARESLAKKM